jgi:hypothetical protein
VLNSISFDMARTSRASLSKFFTLPKPISALLLSLVFLSISAAANAGEVIPFPARTAKARSRCAISINVSTPDSEGRSSQARTIDFYGVDAAKALIESFKTNDPEKDESQRRSYSALAKDPGFGFYQAFREGRLPLRWMNSGMSRSLLTMVNDPFAPGFLSDINDLVVTSDFPQQIVEEVLAGSRGRTMIHPQHVPWNAGSPTIPESLQVAGGFDVITDVEGDATKIDDLGQVIANYSKLLAEGGYLILRLPLRQISDGFQFQKFEDNVGRSFYADRFFSMIPGFELINAFELNQGYYFGQPGPMTEDMMSHPYDHDIRYETFVLRKTDDDAFDRRMIGTTVKRDERGRTTRTLTFHLF